MYFHVTKDFTGLLYITGDLMAARLASSKSWQKAKVNIKDKGLHILVLFNQPV